MGKQKKARKKAERRQETLRVETAPDAVDGIVAAWRRERPELDLDSVEVWSRLDRLAVRQAQVLEETAARHGLSKAGFEALAALSRAGSPHRLTQTQLLQELGLTPGTVSVRVSKLVKDGYVERLPDTDNRRGVVVALTSKGEAILDAAAPDCLAQQRRLLAPLDPGELEALAGLLRRLLRPAQAAALRVE
jgi:DNA-binding MarR family transcriptional regulator